MSSWVENLSGKSGGKKNFAFSSLIILLLLSSRFGLTARKTEDDGDTDDECDRDL